MRTECEICHKHMNLIRFKESFLCEKCAIKTLVTDDGAFNYMLDRKDKLVDFYIKTKTPKGMMHTCLWDPEIMERLKVYVTDDLRDYVSWLEQEPYLLTLDEVRGMVGKEA